MGSIDKKSPFKVPESYFNDFNQKIAQKIDSIEPNSGFRTPVDYFQKIENQILDQVDYHKEAPPSYSNYIWKAMAVASVVVLFFVNEKTALDQNELADFFMEDYLMVNTTYEIAEHYDYSFEVGNFIENYESIAIDDALEIRLYGETPTNLNLFDDE
jgi:hypothetical protein